MSNSIARARAYAFYRQEGRCCYCDYPMYVTSPQKYAQLYGCSHRQALQMQCTAEHLVAKCEGGSNRASNIAAACKLCNLRRHQGKVALPSQAYRELVQSKVLEGRWHPFRLLGPAAQP
ncbi:HNH endonuclease [Pseudomonas batumici]|uniref:HNH endonuclease n=1 Tax=Pseudomonas batumici TaxID=226910 RepID=UPI0030D13957